MIIHLIAQSSYSMNRYRSIYFFKSFSQDALIEKIWGFDYEGDERTVDVHIKRLRKRLEKILVQRKLATAENIITVIV
jgi:DNA-binding response OmpR family regulator